MNALQYTEHNRCSHEGQEINGYSYDLGLLFTWVPLLPNVKERVATIPLETHLFVARVAIAYVLLVPDNLVIAHVRLNFRKHS